MKDQSIKIGGLSVIKKVRPLALDEWGACISYHGGWIRPVAEDLCAPNRFLDDYVPVPLTWRERLHVIWTDRICGAWRVLIGTAYAEYKDYD